MHPYVVELFTEEEQSVLRRYVTNIDDPVFALVDLPEVVKGALYARYSRSAKSLRRLLLDEFAGDLANLQPGTGATTSDGEAATRAGRLYERVFSEYGDDSVAQLGGAHVAVEQASNLLTKQLEWGRLGAYLEQSTRYIAYDDRPGGRYRYYRDPDIMASEHGAAFVETLDAVFDTYATLLPRVQRWITERYPRENGTSEAVHRNAVKAKACDILRGLLPAATVSNVGVFASGQSYEQLLLRLRASEFAEARWVAARMLTELRQVIPSFLTRVDRQDRGVVWSQYLSSTRADTRAVAEALLTGVKPADAPEVALVGWSDDAEVEVVTGMLYPHSRLPEPQLREFVRGMSTTDRLRVLRAYVGQRTNRRHKPGRALERVWYRFDVCGDYGGFRDLQRHRMLTIEWQELSPRHGYDTPSEVADAGIADEWHRTLERQADLYDRLFVDLPRQAQYAVGFAYRLRWSMQLNARAAMQMLELRTTPQGHPSYRRICQQMHRLIAEEAGHTAIAAMMSHVDHGGGELERLEAERSAEARRVQRERTQ
ncbi:MAG: thymidylate synthase [Nitriliruptorales bacterium]|nr:thymidylate synthase [Nitriliruptorales bacterium]